MKRYPAYKESGIEWIDGIPEHWKNIPLKYLLLEGKEGIKIGPFGSSLKLETMQAEGYKVYGQENIIRDDFSSGTRFISEKKYFELQSYQIEPGDILITMMGTTGKAKVVPDQIEDGIMDSHLIRIRSNSDTNPNLISLLINDSYYIFTQIKTNGKGAIMEGLNSSIIKALQILKPPRVEQDKILSYLDHKTRLIDTLIEKKQKQIELLQEQRTGIINQAVTKGLNPNVKMKDTGIEWLGEVPEHWKVLRLKFLTTKIGSGITPRGGAEVYQENGIPLLRSQNIHFDGLRLDDVAYISNEINDSMSGTKVKPNDVLLNITGASIGRCYYVPESLKEANVNQHVCILRPDEKVFSNYLFYYLSSNLGQDQVFTSQVGTSREGLNFEQLKNFVIIVPPKSEQSRIIEYLNHQSSTIFNYNKVLKRQIEKIIEYRTTLISEVVTGKIDVRDEVIP